MRTITTDRADGIYYGDHVAIVEISEHRWYDRQLVVFRDDDSSTGLSGFYYMDPASELQEDQDRYDSDPVQLVEVTAREVTTTAYEVTT